MITLENHRLRVEILEPGSDVYRRTRFDWHGFVTQVTLDGHHTFCAPESRKAKHGTGGIGLCNEFSTSATVGYDEAGKGETFPKFGVGILTKPSRAKYSFFRDYDVVPFPRDISVGPDSVTFTVHPIDCRGYAVRIVKTVSLVENRLSIHTRFENVGTRQIDTHEYNHNFVEIDNLPFGPSYGLTLPFDPNTEDTTTQVALVDNTVTWPTNVSETYCHWLTGFENVNRGAWKLSNSEAGVGMSETTDFPWTKVILFGTPQLTSPEVYVDIHVAPGGFQEWTRDYRFGELGELG